MRACVATCGHYRIVAAYRDERAGQVDRLDRETVWPEEEAAWLDEHGPLIVFRAYLENIGAERREHERMVEQDPDEGVALDGAAGFGGLCAADW